MIIPCCSVYTVYSSTVYSSSMQLHATVHCILYYWVLSIMMSLLDFCIVVLRSWWSYVTCYSGHSQYISSTVYSSMQYSVVCSTVVQYSVVQCSMQFLERCVDVVWARTMQYMAVMQLVCALWAELSWWADELDELNCSSTVYSACYCIHCNCFIVVITSRSTAVYSSMHWADELNCCLELHTTACCMLLYTVLLYDWTTIIHMLDRIRCLWWRYWYCLDYVSTTSITMFSVYTA